MSATATLPTLDQSPARERSRLEDWSNWFLQPAVLIRVVLYLTTLVYLRSVLFDYVYDDSLLITLNPWMESWKQVPQLLTHSFWGFLEVPRTVDFYRPLVSLVFAVIRHLLGPAPGWFHLVAVALHVLATYLVYRLACETVGNVRVAAIAAGLFGLHPTKVETAAWISGISDSLSAVFFVASMIWYFKARNDQEHGTKYKAWSAALLLLALFSKEAAVFAPVLIAIYEFSAANSRLRDRFLTSLRAALPFVAITVVALLARNALIRNRIEHTLTHVPVQSTSLTAPQATLWYVCKQLWPFGLSVQYPEMLVRAFSFRQFVLPLVIILALAVTVLWLIRRKPAAIFFASWFVLMLAPVILYIVFLQEHDRYAYLPSIASSIGLAYLLDRFVILGTRVQSAVILILLVGMAALTFNYESYWDNDTKLFTRVVEIAPKNPNALEYLAGCYVILGQPAKAEAFARSVIADNDGPEGWYILGTVFLSQGKHQEAREALQKAVSLWHGRRLEASLALASANLSLGKNEEAAQLYREQIQRFPDRGFLHGRLATALRAMGRSQEAQQELAIQKSLQ